MGGTGKVGTGGVSVGDDLRIREFGRVRGLFGSRRPYSCSSAQKKKKMGKKGSLSVAEE